MHGKTKLLILLFALSVSSSCHQEPTLPVLGPYQREDGQKKFHPVRSFTLINQEGEKVSTDDFKDQLRIVDFFFTSCPSICPKVQTQMLRIREAFSAEERLVLISHTIDPKRDTAPVLANYAHNLGVTRSADWQFLTGDKSLLYQLADDHFNIVVEDASAPGGFDHTGRIVLLDEAGYIRSFANGLNPASVDTLMVDVRQLLGE